MRTKLLFFSFLLVLIVVCTTTRKEDEILHKIKHIREVWYPVEEKFGR